MNTERVRSRILSVLWGIVASCPPAVGVIDESRDLPADGVGGLALREAVEVRPLDQLVEIRSVSSVVPPLWCSFIESVAPLDEELLNEPVALPVRRFLPWQLRRLAEST